MSAFALPIPPRTLARPLHWPTERSATAFRRQKSEISYQNGRDAGPTASGRSPGTRPASVRRHRFQCSQDRDNTWSTPASRRPIQSHHQEATKLGPRQSLATKTLGQIGADRFRGSPHLIGQCKLLDPREFEARPMHLQRQPVGPLKHLEILGPFDPRAHSVCSCFCCSDF
jgi:hypothetical protein